MTLKPRNPYAWAPQLKKGGAHIQTKKAQRKRAKQQLQRELAQNKGRWEPSRGLCFCWGRLNIFGMPYTIVPQDSFLGAMGFLRHTCPPSGLVDQSPHRFRCNSTLIAMIS